MINSKVKRAILENKIKVHELNSVNIVDKLVGKDNNSTKQSQYRDSDAVKIKQQKKASAIKIKQSLFFKELINLYKQAMTPVYLKSFKQDGKWITEGEICDPIYLQLIEKVLNRDCSKLFLCVEDKRVADGGFFTVFIDSIVLDYKGDNRLNMDSYLFTLHRNGQYTCKKCAWDYVRVNEDYYKVENISIILG
jgi:hypothetical protein